MSLVAELPILPDLTAEDPEVIIGYAWDVEAELGWPTPRGPDRKRSAALIEVLGLDRDSLNQERGRLVAMLEPLARTMQAAIHFDRKAMARRAAADIKRQTKSDQEFAGFRRFYFKQVGLGQYISND